MASTIKEMVAVRAIPPLFPDKKGDTASTKLAFQGLHKFQAMGNRLPIAFGGCVIAQCISAGFASLGPAKGRPDYKLFSAMGNFLGPGATEILTQYEVEDVRTTKTFATRMVTAWQNWGALPQESPMRRGGAELGWRRVMIVTLDFQVPEPCPMMEYSPSPVYAEKPSSLPSRAGKSFMDRVKAFYSNPTINASNEEIMAANHTPEIVKRFVNTFTLFDKYFDVRFVAKSMGIQKAYGIAKTRKTSQDDVPFHQRNNCSWYSCKEGMELDEEKGEHEAAFAFLMDGALAFVPLTFSHQFLNDAAACSTLEYSLRFLSPPRLSTPGNGRNWFLQEQTTEAGRVGRTYSHGRMWDSEGNLVAVMSQMSIMRGSPGQEVQYLAKL